MGLSSGELLLSGFLCLRIEGIILLEFYDFVIKNFFLCIRMLLSSSLSINDSVKYNFFFFWGGG